MWNKDNQCVFLLLIVISGLVFVYKSFKSIGGALVFFLAVIFGYCTLMVNRAYTFELCQIIKTFYWNNIVEKMERRRRSTYQLSSDFFEVSRRGHNLPAPLVEELSPIRKVNYYNCKSKFLACEGRRSLDKLTSSSLIHWDSCGKKIVDVDNGITDPQWGSSFGPKITSRSMGVQSIQTSAGPLLASSRYNIDPKTYTDIRSPGLTSRLTKYAAEANTKLIHQSQYRSGQFPKINLSSSPIPIVNLKSTKLNTPVKVRIAQPKTKYSSLDKHKLLSSCKVNKSIKTSSVGQVLREISLKRHASTDDISDFIKKQRTDELENFEEEISQKRCRDESSRSEDDISIDKTSMRPIKKTKKPSCYDVLSSLSSSSNMVCGVKRKAELSRNDTSEMEKPYKALKNNSFRESTSLNVSFDFIESNKINMSDGDIKESVNNRDSFSELMPKSPKRSSTQEIDQSQSNIEISQISSPESPASQMKKIYAPIKLSERLFMKEEPQNIDQLKALIEDQEDSKIQFSKSSSDEIKKSDIVMMRQTSMKNKLKSMFDAISGNVSSKINPSVVIRADKDDLIPASDSPLNTDPMITTLNSLTSTTSTNTSPISTSAILPYIERKKDVPAKHVTFQLPFSSTALTTNSSTNSTSSLVQQPTDASTPTPIETSNPLSSAPPFNISTSPSRTSKPTIKVAISSNQAHAASVVPKFSFGSSGNSLSTITTTKTSDSSFSLSNIGENSTAASGFLLPASTTSSESLVTSSNALQIISQTSSPIAKSNIIFATQPVVTTNLLSSGNIPSLFDASSTNKSQSASLIFDSTSISKPSANALGISASSSSITQMNPTNATNLKADNGFKINVSSSGTFPTFGSSASTAITPGNFAPATTLAADITTPAFSFDASDKKQFTFGVQSTLPETTGTAIPTTSSFTTPSTSIDSKFSIVSSASMFSVTSPASSSTSIFTSSGASSSLFPTTTVSQNNSQQPTSIFQTSTQKNLSVFTSTSAKNLFGVSKTAPLPSFGATVTTTSNLYNTPPTTATSSLFGASGKSSHLTTKQSHEFGPTFESSSIGSFSNNSNNLFSNNPASDTTFCKPNSDTPTLAFGELISGTSTFKATNSAVSVFGSSTENTLNSSNTNNITSSFGTSNGSTSLFQNVTSSGFIAKNSALPAFGTHSQPPPPFPVSNTSFSELEQTAKNTCKPNQSTTSSGFGSHSFASPSGNNDVNSPFTFGTSQSATSQPQGQSSKIFGFSGAGSTTDKQASKSTSLFQFGTSQAAQTSGQFNFSANTPALSSTPSFSAQPPSAFGPGIASVVASGNGGGGGMFSIGSGSTAPRRAIRQARRQR
ncbi:mucin-5AC-like isoform X1 [Aphidius gifuensis]|uniref:mucin-5AC-like isoform X1 n=1 Tax=Aphidius gifuensis TaxID=684658 RepID=UPI001CDBA85A|nr:mucin-5AC-like isoform X1 [Aphidius gifuensis]